MPKIVLVEPCASNLHIFSQFPLPRLGGILLGTLMKEKGWEVELFVEEIRKLDFAALLAADIVGISTITSTAPRAYAIAGRLRERGIPVLLGGPHVTFLPDEGLRYADFVLRGEAEATLPVFLDAWKRGLELESVPGLSYRREGEIRHNPPADPILDLDALPFPDLSLLRPDRKPGLRSKTIPVQTSRGCPFACTFCSVTGMFGRAYRHRSTENIISELRRYDSRRSIIFFYDDNFAADRRRARDLCEAMIRERFKFRWSTQVRADLARDPALVRLMKKAGCHTVYVGFESVNPRSLLEMRKAQSVEELERAVRVFHAAGIHIHGMFVFGFDQDDAETVRATVAWAKKARLMSTQFLILTPLPGSEFYERAAAENRIAFKDWSLYDAHHAVFQPARFTLADLQWAQIKSHSRFYSFPQQVRKFFAGRWLDLGLAHYARVLNKTWKRRNRTFLKALDLLRPRRGSRVSVDYREDTALDL